MADIPPTTNVAIWDDEGNYSVGVTPAGRLLVSTEPPPGRTPIRYYVSSLLGSVGTYDYEITIPSGETWHIDVFGGGSEKLSQEILLWNGEEVHRLFTDANQFEVSVNRDFVGDGTKKLILRRINAVANQQVVIYIVGYK